MDVDETQSRTDEFSGGMTQHDATVLKTVKDRAAKRTPLTVATYSNAIRRMNSERQIYPPHIRAIARRAARGKPLTAAEQATLQRYAAQM